MHKLKTSLHANTPSITVFDARNLRIRDLCYHRHPDSPTITSERITLHQYDARGFLAQSADPRLSEAGLANFVYIASLSGSVLSLQGADNGSRVTLADAAGRSLLVANNIPGVGEGADRSQVVTRTFQYEESHLPGRLVSVTEQTADEVCRISELLVYAGNSDAEVALNLAGQCVSHYDAAGLVQSNSVALTGVPQSITRRLLKDADDPDTVVDWRGGNASVWNGSLAAEDFTHLTVIDATGAVYASTDAAGNQQRVTYDVAGLLAGSWLTVKGHTEQVVVKARAYSATGQALREEHGNGVLTLWTYEAETQRLARIETARPVGHVCGAKVLQDLSYEYDPVGNVLGVRSDSEETRFWRNQKVVPGNTYVYDSLYQVVKATGRQMANADGRDSFPPVASSDNATYTNYTRAYSYDAAGNLIQIRHRAPATNNNQITDITISNRSNRGVLNTLTENPEDVDALFTTSGQQKVLQPGQPLLWSARNELFKVTPVMRDSAVDDSEIYRYDSASQRRMKFSSQKVSNRTRLQRVIYLPSLELRAPIGSALETERLQVISVGTSGRSPVRVLHWDGRKPKSISNNQYRYSYDNLIGSSGLEVDGEGKVISQEEYYPYGGTAVWTTRDAVEASFKTIRYSGKERDATGLYYYGWRYYQPWVGRWLSADPAGTKDGINLFVMVGNNPVTFCDTNGLYKEGQEARQLVGETFVHPLHMPAFEKVSKEHSVAVSVRESGSHTIKALGEGAAAKGHNILEKTIKPASLKSAYGERAEALLEQAERSGLVGRVGQWNRAGVRGIYARNSISEEDVSYRVNLQNPVEHELVDAWIKFKVVTPYTGDYDMHDIIQVKGGKGILPGSGSVEEAQVMDSLNHAIAELDPVRPFDNTSMNMIRHGPQVNFVAHMWRHEFDKVKRDNGYLGAVARPGPFPIAMVNQGQWTIIESSSELFDFYRSVNTAVPDHWAQAFVSRGGGMVATPRHAKVLDWHRSQTI
ncbi:RHS repeat-associated core domain-containing protein [Pseudomonas sp. B26140]|uniref:RHS repeat-associated core domain-containing protein n=1 Tax=Pseudomonas sp. B26140 TaxID=3235112 RepID=UPI0037852786